MPEESQRELAAKARADTDQARLDFLRTEIDSATVFAKLAETEGRFGDWSAACAALAKSERACEVAVRLLGQAHLRGQTVEHFEFALDGARKTIAHLRERFSAVDPQSADE